MASLTSIPLELLVLISYDLATKDLGSLRCTCKQIEKSLFDYFTQEFFSKRQFMFTQPSLQSLVDISNHGFLSKQLKHVILSMDRYCEATRDFGDSDAAEKYMQGYADQKTLLDNGLARELLTEAFQKLPSLETIGIRDYNNRGRIRDDGAEWRSYGAPTVHAETGFQLTSNPSLDHYNRETVPKLFASRIFSTTYYALGKAGRSPPEFEILLRKPNGGLCDQAFNIPDFTLPVIGPVLRGTKSLLLSLNLQETHPPLLIDHDNIVCSGRLLRKFLGYTSNLTHLRLNFQKLHIRENDDFLRWLGEPIATGPYSYAPYLPVPVALPCLQRLDIGMLQTNTQTLLSPLVKFAPSLKKVSIWKVTLSPPIHPNLNRDPFSNFWLRFFDTLSKLPNFQPDYLLFGLLGHDYFHVKFKVAIPDEDDETLPNADGDEEEEVERTHKMEFTGRTGMNEFLKSLVRRVEVQYPKPQVIRGPSTVDDEEEVEEESE